MYIPFQPIEQSQTNLPPLVISPSPTVKVIVLVWVRGMPLGYLHYAPFNSLNTKVGQIDSISISSGGVTTPLMGRALN